MGLDQLEDDLRRGAGAGFGFCSAALLTCVLVVLCLVFGCSVLKQDADKAEAKRVEQEAFAKDRLAKSKLLDERRAKLVARGIENPPPIDESSIESIRKQMRIEGVDPDKNIMTLFKDANARIDACAPLKEAVREAMVGHVEGEVLMLEELAGVRKGDTIDSVMAKFDAPLHRGETNNVLHYGNGWPDMMYYSYGTAGVTFLVKGSFVDLILVGLTYGDAVRR